MRWWIAGDCAEGGLAVRVVRGCADAVLLGRRSTRIMTVSRARPGRAAKLTSERAADWRTVPLLTALAVGATSTEADLWLVDGELLVCLVCWGGSERALTLLWLAGRSL